MNSNRSTQLEARVKKIEELLKLVQSSNADVHRTVPEPVQEDIRISKELPAADFWQQLTDEVCQDGFLILITMLILTDIWSPRNH